MDRESSIKYREADGQTDISGQTDIRMHSISRRFQRGKHGIDESYGLVVKGLTRKQREGLDLA